MPLYERLGYKLVESVLVALFMGILRAVATGIVCSSDGFVAAQPAIECYTASHSPMAMCGTIGLFAMYAPASIVRPIFQSIDPKMQIRFRYTFLVVVSQIQAALVLVVAFYPDNTQVLLWTSLVVDVVLVSLFACWRPVDDRKDIRGPCSVPSINSAGAIAFSVSAWLNICSLLAEAQEDDLTASLLLFVVLFLVSAYVFDRARRVYFIAGVDDLLNTREQLCTRFLTLKTMARNDIVQRIAVFFINISFWWTEVGPSETEKDWDVRGILVTIVKGIECALIGVMRCTIIRLCSTKRMAHSEKRQILSTRNSNGSHS
jgi:hypothetical protein